MVGLAEHGFRHEALFYASRDEFLERTLDFLQAGFEADEPALVVLNRDKIEALRDELGARARDVAWADMADIGRNPARIIPAWRQFLQEHEGRSSRGIGEPIWAGRSAPELVECQRHESLLNLAFDDVDAFYLLCPYDTTSLDDAVLDEACRSHPYVALDGVSSDSSVFRGLEEIAAPFGDALPEPRTDPLLVQVFQAPTLAAVRQSVLRRALDAGFDRSASEELALGVSEVATNSVVHGGGGGLMRLWEEDATLICEVSDTGRMDQPLAGRERPTDGQIGGFGLWLANHVCDLVQVRSFPGSTTVRLRKRRH